MKLVLKKTASLIITLFIVSLLAFLPATITCGLWAACWRTSFR